MAPRMDAVSMPASRPAEALPGARPATASPAAADMICRLFNIGTVSACRRHEKQEACHLVNAACGA
jgi:hypothetical protein